jgi:hypothetical protein
VPIPSHAFKAKVIVCGEMTFLYLFTWKFFKYSLVLVRERFQEFISHLYLHKYFFKSDTLIRIKKCSEGSLMEILIVIVIIAILVALGFGLIGMVKGGQQGSDKMFKSLVTRVTLSIVLFLFVIFAGYMGWIQPNTVILDAPSMMQK